MRLLEVEDLAGSPLWQQLWTWDDLQHPWYLPDQLTVAATHCPTLYYLPPALRPAIDLGDVRGFQPLGLIAHDSAGPVLGLTLSIERIGAAVRLSAFGRPLFPIEDRSASGARRRTAAKLVFRHLERLRGEYGAVAYHLRDPLAGGRLSMLSELVLREGGRALPFFSQLVDLGPSLENVLADLRDSVRNTVRRDGASASIEVVTAEDVTEEHRDRLRLLHHRQHGRELRSNAGWEALLAGVRSKTAFLLFGFSGRECTAAAYFPYSARYCHYSVAANDPERPVRGQSHLMLWRAMQYSRSLGCRYFEVGDRTYPGQHEYVTEKFHAISHFKSGFGGSVATRMDVLSAE